MSTGLSQYILLLLLCVLPLSRLQPKNLTLHSTLIPSNHELMDIEIEKNLMIATGGLGGAVLYDISHPAAPTEIAEIQVPGFPHLRTYKWDIGVDKLVGTGRDAGMVITEINNAHRLGPLMIHNPEENLLTYRDTSRTAKISLEDVEIVRDVAIFTAHSDGVLFYDIGKPQAPRLFHQILTGNAWSLLHLDDYIYIADSENGIHIIDIAGITDSNYFGLPELVKTIPVKGTPKDIKYHNDHIFVAAGAEGVHAFQLKNPVTLEFVDGHKTAGFASRIAIMSNRVAVSAWSEVQVFEWNNRKLTLVGYKNTGGRVMAVGSPGGDLLYAAEWSRMRIYEYGPIADPDIDLSTRVLGFRQSQQNGSDTLTVTISNNGQSRLEFVSLATTDEAFSFAPHPQSLNSGESIELEVVYKPTSGTDQGQLNIVTNDPDEETVYIQLKGNNGNGIQTGKPAPNFELPVIANSEKATLSLEELKGKVVVLAFFASW